MRRYVALLILILLVGGSAHAQTGGQFCVRAFEDRNGNGQLDSGEPFLTRGVSVNLLNADGVAVASALLDSSPTAAQGVICFQFLQAGQYTLEITSPDFTPTTPGSVTASITEGTLPTVVQYGAQRVVVATATPAAAAEIDLLDEENLPRLVLSALGALVVLAGMVVLGVLIYLVALRRPSAPAAYGPPPSSTRTPTVTLDETISPDDEDVSESRPLVMEDTDQIKPV